MSSMEDTATILAAHVDVREKGHKLGVAHLAQRRAQSLAAEFPDGNGLPGADCVEQFVRGPEFPYAHLFVRYLHCRPPLRSMGMGIGFAR